MPLCQDAFNYLIPCLKNFFPAIALRRDGRPKQKRKKTPVLIKKGTEMDESGACLVGFIFVILIAAIFFWGCGRRGRRGRRWNDSCDPCSSEGRSSVCSDPCSDPCSDVCSDPCSDVCSEVCSSEPSCPPSPCKKRKPRAKKCNNRKSKSKQCGKSKSNACHNNNNNSRSNRKSRGSF